MAPASDVVLAWINWIAAYQALSANPDTRQAVLQIWDCTIDLPNVDGTPRSADIPCNIMSCLKVRDGRLDWTQMLRSNDLVLGTPYNIIQFTTLQEVLAGWLGLELGTYVQMSDSLHIYDRDIEVISNLALDPLPANTDSLMLPKMESDRFFGLLEERIEGLSKPLTSARLVETAQVLDAPQSFQNLLAIMGAEAARRQKSEDAMARCMEFCHNPALLELWARWRQRFAR
jgi:thymidylate synthase